jgi:hypothetical protein
MAVICCPSVTNEVRANLIRKLKSGSQFFRALSLSRWTKIADFVRQVDFL